MPSVCSIRAATTQVAGIPPNGVPGKRCRCGDARLASVARTPATDIQCALEQERIFKRQGFTVVGSTLSDWVDASTELLSVVVEAMWHDVRENASYCIVDATGLGARRRVRCRGGGGDGAGQWRPKARE